MLPSSCAAICMAGAGAGAGGVGTLCAAILGVPREVVGCWEEHRRVSDPSFGLT